GVRGVADRAVSPCGLLDFDGNRGGIPNPGRRVAGQVQRPDCLLRRPSDQWSAPVVRHSRGGLLVRVGAGHRGAAAVGAPASARSAEEHTVSLSYPDIPGAFDAGAPSYDRLVDANPGYHAHLRLSARRLRLVGHGEGLRLLDAGCGTGASTAALLSVAPRAEIVAVDASPGMLAQAVAKPWPASVRFVHSRCENLAHAGVRGPF